MSPIFVRPVREQLEHDRLIRHLQVKYKRKLEVAMNPGDEQTAPVKLGNNTFFPDLVIMDGKKLAGLVEVESGESVNNLEAMAQWVPFSRARAPFHLYVPVQAYDAARRLCEAHHIHPTEVWTYRALLDGFDLVRMSTSSGPSRPSAESLKARPAPPAPPEPVLNGRNGIVAAPAAREGAKDDTRPAARVREASKDTKDTKAAKDKKKDAKAKPKKASPAKPAKPAAKARPKPNARKKAKSKR